jgi:hypothetical protein
MATSRVNIDTADFSKGNLIKIAEVVSELMALFYAKSISFDLIKVRSEKFYKRQVHGEGQVYDGPGILYKAIFGQEGAEKGLAEVIYHSRLDEEPADVALKLARDIVTRKLEHVSQRVVKMAAMLQAEVASFESFFQRPGAHPGPEFMKDIVFLLRATTEAAAVLDKTKPKQED